jgi:uncharacterized protein (DUF488 family)
VHLLRQAGITAVADVRSVPFSRRTPHFNRGELQRVLESVGIAYVFLGGQLGARPEERSCYRDGVADYSLIARSSAFADGLRRVEEGAGRYRIALMCAERDPLDCHRTLLVARHLQDRGSTICHILADGRLEPNEITEKRLLDIADMRTADLFSPSGSVEKAIANAYERRGHKIAYREECADATGSAMEG